MHTYGQNSMYNYYKKNLNTLNIRYFLPWGTHERHGQSRPAAIFFGFYASEEFTFEFASVYCM